MITMDAHEVTDDEVESSYTSQDRDVLLEMVREGESDTHEELQVIVSSSDEIALNSIA